MEKFNCAHSKHTPRLLLRKKTFQIVQKHVFQFFLQLFFGKIVKTHHKKTLWQLPPSKGY